MNKSKIISFLTILIISGVLLSGCGKKPVTKVQPSLTPEEETIPTVSPKEFEANITARADQKAVILTITKYPKTTTSMEYELTYDTDGVERGVMGTINVDQAGSDQITREILLGTCSKNVCVYDKNVKSIKLVLRIETSKGTQSWSKAFDINSTE